MTLPAPDTDTICAISTPSGVGGIAIARVSGPRAISIADKIWQGKPLGTLPPRTAHLGTVTDTAGQPLDNALVTTFRTPASFTGEDIVEISVHGSRWIQQELISSLIQAGCRIAEPGEFTRRAFANSRIDLIEAEAIADLIDSTSRAAHRIAINQMRGSLSRSIETLRQQLLELASLLELELDFAEEDVEFADRTTLIATATKIAETTAALTASFAAGTAIKEGIPVAIAGPTNAGKSTILNLLSREDRAIVSDIHGTTRDTIETTIEIDSLPLRIIDTAGLRHTDDIIENLGIQRTLQAIDHASIILNIIDATTAPATPSPHIPNTHPGLITIINKTDLLPTHRDIEKTAANIARDHHLATPPLTISAIDPAARDTLAAAITAKAREIGLHTHENDIIITNARHHHALNDAHTSILRVIQGLRQGISADFIAQDLRDTIHHLGLITGDITPSDILASIFSRFCIGK